MGMHSYVLGFKPPNKKFRDMLKAYKACEDAGIDIPDEISDFFNGETPDETGVSISLSDTNAVTPYHEDSRDGYEIDLDKLSKDIRIIRFVNSY